MRKGQAELAYIDGLLVQVNDNEMMVRVTVPAKCSPPPAFITECHETAGNLGYGIEFVRA